MLAATAKIETTSVIGFERFNMIYVPNSCSDQFLHRLMPVHNEMRTAGKIGDGRLVYINTQIVIKRGKHLTEGHRPLGRFAAQPVSGTDDLAGLHTATSEQGTRHLRPMIAPGIL